MLSMLTRESFSPYLNQKFQIEADGAAVEAELLEIKESGTAAAGRRQPFSLTFRAAGNTVFPQRIYTVRHNDLGSLDIFLVPVGVDPAGVLYQAVFT